MGKYRGLGRATGAARGLWLGCGLAMTVACGQEAPADVADSTQDYFPLVAGAWWQYAHSDWPETVSVRETDFNGAPAYLVSDSPNPDDSLRSDSIIASVGGRAARMTKEEYLIGPDGSETLTSSVSYGSGFTRFNQAWASQPVGYTETPEYQRVETLPGQAPKAPEARRHTFEIIALDEEVGTPRGTFRCIVIQRTKDWEAAEAGLDPDEADTKRYWFAPGVGKVQELNVRTGNAEVLTDFMIPAL